MLSRIPGWLTHPLLALCFRLYLGGLFVYASMGKINNAAGFADTIASYQLLPYFLTPAMAVVLPWLELISGVILVVGFRVRSAAAAIIAMLLMFTLALAWAIARDIPIDCGCFQNATDPISLATLARDLAWLAMALHVYRYDRLLQVERSFFPQEVVEE